MTLEDNIIEVLGDGRAYNVRWIKHKLERLGVSVTTARIRIECQRMSDAGIVEMLRESNRSMEWRLVQ